MCGILGMYLCEKGKEINRTLFESALISISHRGPDAKTAAFFSNLAIGHVRLSIIDASENANQPFYSHDKKFAIVFNGEIFNYKSLRNELEKNGEVFYTNSDTEVLLSLLRRDGIDSLHRLNGFFAFAFYDFEKNKLILARDRFGEKPLFYSVNEKRNELVFASEMKAVFGLVKKRKLNQTALELLLQLNYIPAPYTIDENIHKLLPGHYIEAGNEGISLRKWYGLPVKHSGDPETESVNTIRSKIRLAVERRMVSDFPVGGFLSGGIDSSIVCGLAKEINSGFESFSMGFEENKLVDETSDAELAAKHFGIKHHSLRLGEKEILENAFDILNKSDEPFADSSMIALFSLCKKLKGKYKVMLSGDGADEVFGGYNKHKALWLAQQKRFSNSLVKTVGGAHRLFPKSRHGYIGSRARKLQKMHQLLNKNDFEQYWYLASFSHEFSSKLLVKNSIQETNEKIKIQLENFSQLEGFNVFFEYDIHLVLPNDMLYKVDMASMMNGLEVRSPFLDHELIEYTMNLKPELKLKNGQQKYLLKKAFDTFLPKQLIVKPKHGFEVPMKEWLNGPLNNQMNELLNDELVLKQGIFQPSTINLLKNKVKSVNSGDAPMLIWTLMNFQKSWLNYYN